MRKDKDSSGFLEQKAPLASRISLSTCTGYHTPIEDDIATSALIEGEGPPSEMVTLDPRVSQRGSLMLPSPLSAITASLEAYLEPQRFSFSSPPESTDQHRPSSPEETYPVFSPPQSATEVSPIRTEVSKKVKICVQEDNLMSVIIFLGTFIPSGTVF